MPTIYDVRSETGGVLGARRGARATMADLLDGQNVESEAEHSGLGLVSRLLEVSYVCCAFTLSIPYVIAAPKVGCWRWA